MIDRSRHFSRIRRKPAARRLLAASLVLFACCAQAAFTRPKELTVVTDINYPPYLFLSEEGRPQGILPDKWALWSQRTGVPVTVVGLEWAIAQRSVQDGSNEVLEAVSFTEARKRLYEFSPPYAPVEARVFFHRSISGINDLASMRGFAIGAKAGSACANHLAEHGIATIRNYPSSESLVKAAGAGEVRLFCMDSPVARYFLFKQGLAEEFRETPPLYSTQFHWAVRKGQTELRDFIQQGYAGISAAELEEIDARWLGSPLRFPISRRFLTYAGLIAAVALGLALLLIGWNRGLQRRVAVRTSELRAAMESLQASKEKIEDLYNRAPCGYHSLDMDGVIVEINDTELQWLGYARENVAGKRKLVDFMTEASRRTFADNHAEFKARGEIRDLQYDLVRKDGSIFSALLSATMVRDPGGGNLMSRSTLYDVTERKRHEEELERLNAELEQRVAARTQELAAANRELEAFSYSVSHDLRSPLRGIDGFSHLLVSQYGAQMDPEARRLLERIRAGAQRMGLLITDLLQLSRVVRSTVESAEVDLTALAQSVVRESNAEAGGRAVEWYVEPGMMVRGDPGLLRIALVNLLGNSLKYTRDVTPARIACGVSRRMGNQVEIFVRDNGAGFDMTGAERLFQPFQRLHGAHEFEGTGIGLATVQRVIAKHGGEIRGEGCPGAGASFYFTLPI